MNRPEYIVDTNVLLVASELSEMSLDCQAKCLRFVQKNKDKAVFVLDEGFEIFKEYQIQLNAKGGRWGDMFLKYLLANCHVSGKVKLIPITKIQENEYEEYPESLQSVDIDHSDKKFIALANSNKGLASIVQASDSKWIGWVQALAQEKIRVEFLCEEELIEIYRRKMG